MTSAPRSSSDRPLSPHLQIYRPYMSMTMSIFHRLTGTALYFGAALLAAWLVAAALGPKAFADAQWLAGSILGKLVLFGFTWALLHHALGGIRHFIWDTIHGFEKQNITLLAWLTLIGSLGLSVLIWGAVYVFRGGF